MSDAAPPPPDVPGTPGASPPADDQNPYGQNPYPRPPADQGSYGQGSYGQNPYGQNPPGQYSGQPGYPHPGYGYPPPGPDPGRRPGTVLAACLIAIITSGLTALISGVGLIGVVLARDNVLTEIERQPGFQDTGVSADSIVTLVVVVMVVLVIWSGIGMVLGFLAMRRSGIARIGLVVSAVAVAVFALIGITSIVSAVWLVAAVATIVLLFVGGAGDWYARRPAAGPPPPSPW